MFVFRLYVFVCVVDYFFFFFFFSSRRRHTRWPRDWSSDVCSSDLRRRRGRRGMLTRPSQQRDARILFGALALKSRASVVADEGGQEEREQGSSRDAEHAARYDRRAHAEESGDDAGLGVAEQRAGSVAHHLDSGESPAQVVWDGLVPD